MVTLYYVCAVLRSSSSVKGRTLGRKKQRKTLIGGSYLDLMPSISDSAPRVDEPMGTLPASSQSIISRVMATGVLEPVLALALVLVLVLVLALARHQQRPQYTEY